MLFVKRFATLVLCFCLITLGVAVKLWAQTDRGTITGTVTDPTGAVIIGARVTATNTATRVSTETTTTSTGKYTIPLLLPGIYEVAVEQTGFKKYVQTSIVVEVAQTVRVDAAMQLGESTQSVEVTAEAIQIQSDTSDRGTVITGKEVLDLPLVTQGEQRNPALFITLAPGVTGRGTVTSTATGSGRGLNTTVNGSMSGSLEFHLDGAVIGQGYVLSGQFQFLPFPPDAVGEFKIMTLMPPAEFGQTGLGITNFTLKSGTNQLHGSAYEYFRNDALDARGFFAAKTPINKQNEFGATAGGPIFKDKTFFFGWYHGFRLRKQPGANAKDTVPTDAMKGGDLSNILGAQVGTDVLGRPVYSNEIYDPATTRTVPAGARDTATGLVNTSGSDAILRDGIGFNPVTGLPIAGQANIIPSNRIDPVAQKIFSYFPSPAPCSTCQFGYRDNWIGQYFNKDTIDDWGAKIDHAFSSRNRIYGEFIWAKDFNPTGSKWPGAISEGADSTIGSRILRLSHDFFFRPNVINHWTFGFNRRRSDTFPQAGLGWPEQLGYKGVPGTGPGSTFVQMDIGGLGATYARGGQGYRADNSFSIDENLSWIKGKHSIKAGFNYIKLQLNAFSASYQSSYLTFNAGTTALPDARYYSDGCGPGGACTGIGVAGFLLGQVSKGIAGITTAAVADRMGRYAWYVQDDFKATSKLTFNLGLRHDLFLPMVGAHNQISWFDPQVANTDLGIKGALVFATPERRAGSFTYTRNFGPRFGLAYSLNDKTVLRAGYGILYTPGGAHRSIANGWEQLGFNASNSVNLDTSTAFTGLLAGVVPACPGLHMTLQDGWPAQCFVNPPFINQNFQNGLGPMSFGAFPGDEKAPYIQNWSLGLQREIPGQILLDVAYVGSKGTRLTSRIINNNAMPTHYLSLQDLIFKNIADPAVQALSVVQAMPVDPATGMHSPFKGFEALWGSNAVLGQALRPFPQYQVDTVEGLSQMRDVGETQGMSTYHAFQVQARKRLSQGLNFLVSYTFSKTLTDAESLFNEFSGFTQDNYNRKAEKSLSINDYPQNLVLSYQYELPFGPGKKFLKAGGVSGKVLGGWSIAGIQQYQSGHPQLIITGGNPYSPFVGPLFFLNRPNVVPGVNKKSDAILNGTWDPNGVGAAGATLNINAWSDPAANPATKFTIGNAPRTDGGARTFPYYNEDISIIKRTRINERVSVEFRADLINVFNRVLFATDQGGDQYGALQGQNLLSSGIGGFSRVAAQSNPPREIQFGLKINY